MSELPLCTGEPCWLRDSDVDSELEIKLEPEGSGTRLTLKHMKLPDHGMQYKQGWIDHYFAPMKAHFQK